MKVLKLFFPENYINHYRLCSNFWVDFPLKKKKKSLKVIFKRNKLYKIIVTS